MWWRVIRSLVDLYLALQYAYWGICYVAYSLGYWPDPHVSPDWLALSLFGSALLMFDVMCRNFPERAEKKG